MARSRIETPAESDAGLDRARRPAAPQRPARRGDRDLRGRTEARAERRHGPARGAPRRVAQGTTARRTILAIARDALYRLVRRTRRRVPRTTRGRLPGVGL